MDIEIEDLELSPDDSETDYVYRPPRQRKPGNEQSAGGMSATDWTLISAAASDGPEQRPSLERLARRYWSALYAFVRASGHSADDASDLTQGFLCDVVLSRDLLQHADESRGRFRSLLLTALQNYMRERHRYNTRGKRSDEGRPTQSIDAASMSGQVVDQWALRPEQVFMNRWSTSLVEQVLERVRMECENDQLELHWLVFEARLVRPMLFGGVPAPYEELIDRLGLETVSQASNMMVTVKRRFARSLREEVASTLGDPELLEVELETLLNVLMTAREVPANE